jgi:ATP-dependent DNA helicase RecG
LTQLPGVTAPIAARAEVLGIATVGDLLLHLPGRYSSYDDARLVRDAAMGQEVAVRVQLHSIRLVPTRKRGLRLVRAVVGDASGRMEAVWFNQGHLLKMLTPGDELLLRGVIGPGSPPRMTVKAHEVLGTGASEGLHTQGLVPVYPATEALPVTRLREMVDAARPFARSATEVLPTWIRARLNLMPIADAIVAAHFPRNAAEGRAGRLRLVTEELVVLQIGLLLMRRSEATRRRALRLVPTGAISEPLRGGLSFRLTREQERALADISRDLRRPAPMRRLLQGEVGSGKTIVSVLAMCQAVEAGAQAALLVPTETLAEQHLRTLDELLAPTGITPVLITGKVPAAERQRRLMALATGTASIAVGTQALLSEGVRFSRLGLVVVDEQHRFGVEQRQLLSERSAVSDDADGPETASHILYMTATPIPRTLALTSYGDLEVSSIRGRPPGRSPVETRWIRAEDREDAYTEVRTQLRAGRQAYVICPMVGDADSAPPLDDGPDEARAAIAEAERLRDGPFREFRVGLAHGALKADDKRAAMLDFAEGRIDVLVATTVVEVGIDVANATVIIIEAADRFGLAQLHQLRGRVGRGREPGVCLLFADPTTEDGSRRLEALTQTTDGFRLAELDLVIRGEGAILGLRQAGPTDLRFARLSRDRRPLAEARHVAKRTLARDPRLEAPEHRLLRDAVAERFVDLPRLLDG